LLDNSVPNLHDFKTKPWGLAEWGVLDRQNPGGPFEQQFYADAAASVHVFDRLKAYVIFDSDRAQDFRVDDTPAEAESYRRFAQNPYFNQPRNLPGFPQ